MTEQTQITSQKAAVQTDGVRARRAFMLKQFLPNADWINVNVVAKGKGTQVIVGRVFGTCTGFEDKMNTLPDGSSSKSVALTGIFQQESALTGELSESSTVYLPMAYAEKVKAIFSSDDSIKLIEIDCDIGLEATGKTIPYEWVVVAYLEGQEMERLKALRRNRRPGMSAAKTLELAHHAAPALEHQGAEPAADEPEADEPEADEPAADEPAPKPAAKKAGK